MPKPLPQTTPLYLPNGRLVECSVRRSQRGRRLRISVCGRTGVTVILPTRGSWDTAQAFLQEKASWVEQQLNRYAALAEKRAATLEPLFPDAIVLPALNRQLTLQYKTTADAQIRIDSISENCLQVCGPVEIPEQVHAALRDYLRTLAQQVLPKWFSQVAQEVKISYERLCIRSQRTRWGSCSARGTITLNDNLLFLAEDLVRHVMIHELCHRIEPNHSARFWALVHSHDPATQTHRGALREALWTIPSWARRT